LTEAGFGTKSVARIAGFYRKKQEVSGTSKPASTYPTDMHKNWNSLVPKIALWYSALFLLTFNMASLKCLSQETADEIPRRHLINKYCTFNDKA
jgi:hypothetical protein